METSILQTFSRSRALNPIQALQDAWCRAFPRRSLAQKFLWRVADPLKRCLIRVLNPLVRYRVDSFEIAIPLSHSLPEARLRFPDYSANLGRIAALAYKQYSGLVVVDIGANVGDSAAILRSHCPAPILAVEGDEHYHAILTRNLAGLGPQVHAVRSLIGPKASPRRGRLHHYEGSTYFDPAGEGASRFERLPDILARHPRYAGRKLLVKIDTDGFDTEILRSEAPELGRRRAILFFEYDPYHAARLGFDASRVFKDLARAGYDRLLFYQNNGDFLVATRLRETGCLEDLHRYYSGREGRLYADICVLPRGEEKLFRLLREQEHAHARAGRAASVEG